MERSVIEDCNQTRAPLRQERTVGDLPLEFRRPAARNRSLAGRTAAVCSHPILLYVVTVATDQRVAAVVALCVFVVAHHARQVSRVNVAQARLIPDFYRS